MAASYFLLRVQQQGNNPGGLSGAVERLSTGEKRSFQTAQELIHLLGDWPVTSKMLRPDPDGKALDQGTVGGGFPNEKR